MKNVTAAIIIALVFSVFLACGSDSPPYIPPIEPPPVIINTVDFSCISVDNDQACSGILNESGIWNSGPVQTTGNPMPQDYLNLEITNNSLVNASVFAYTLFTINGCGDNPYTLDAGVLLPSESMSGSFDTHNVRCGALGYQKAIISLYNASGFNREDYADPWFYPRTDLITNAVVIWDNRVPGDMP